MLASYFLASEAMAAAGVAVVCRRALRRLTSSMSPRLPPAFSLEGSLPPWPSRSGPRRVPVGVHFRQRSPARRRTLSTRARRMSSVAFLSSHAEPAWPHYRPALFWSASICARSSASLDCELEMRRFRCATKQLQETHASFSQRVAVGVEEVTVGAGESAIRGRSILPTFSSQPDGALPGRAARLSRRCATRLLGLHRPFWARPRHLRGWGTDSVERAGEVAAPVRAAHRASICLGRHRGPPGPGSRCR